MASILEVLNSDAILESMTDLYIRLARYPTLLKRLKMIDEYDRWEKGKKLRILLVGYNGARNTGADVRVEGMVRQFYHILGEENIEINILTMNIENTQVYFKEPTNLLYLSSIFFRDLMKASCAAHMAVLSEGSCFKSKFANALTTFFFAGAGIMKKQNKPCIAYGSEAGAMDPLLKWFVKRHCNKAYIISRTEQSMKEVEKLGFKGEVGTDTAWIFPPGDENWAIEELKKHNWDGKKPLLGIAVIDPFCWPVRPNFLKFIKMKLLKEKREDNYDKWYFFSTSPMRKKYFKRYIDGIADSVNEFISKYDMFPVIFAMERLDYKPCIELQQKIKGGAPFFWSEKYDGYQITVLLHQLSALITSRYHARVLSMPAGVPSCAISMDERLYNLLTETGHLTDYYLDVDDPELKDKLPPMLEKLWQNREKVKEELLSIVPTYFKKMANMGKTFKKFIKENFEGLPLPPDPGDWLGYLPPLHPKLQKVVEKYYDKKNEGS